MNESDWLSGTDPERMLRHLAASGARPREVRWFVSNCLRHARLLLEELDHPGLENEADRFRAGVSGPGDLAKVLPPVRPWPADVHELAIAIVRFCIEASAQRVGEVLADAALSAYASALKATEALYATGDRAKSTLEGVFRAAWAEAWSTDEEIAWLEAWDDVVWIATSNRWPDLLTLAAMAAGLTDDYPSDLPRPVRWPPMQHPSSLPWSRNAAPAETGDIARDRLAEQLGLAGCCMTDDQGQRREFDPFREWQQRQYAILLRRNVSNPFDPEGRRARERRERLIAQLDTFRGKEAIARELHLISRVHVDEISTDAQALSVRLTLIPTPGLCNARRRNSWVMWGHLSEWDFSEDLRHWTLTHIGTLQFDAGLIAALVRSGQDHASQPYNVDDVHGWIRAHRRDELASRLGAGAATLFWENRPIAQLTEHDLVRYPSIRGRYTVLDFDPELRDALRRHALLMSVPSLRHLSRDGLFLAGWSVDAGGVRVRTPTPTVDLRGDYVIWSDHGRAEADTVVRTLAASDGPEQHEEKSSRPDCP